MLTDALLLATPRRWIPRPLHRKVASDRLGERFAPNAPTGLGLECGRLWCGRCDKVVWPEGSLNKLGCSEDWTYWGMEMHCEVRPQIYQALTDDLMGQKEEQKTSFELKRDSNSYNGKRSKPCITLYKYPFFFKNKTFTFLCFFLTWFLNWLRNLLPSFRERTWLSRCLIVGSWCSCLIVTVASCHRLLLLLLREWHWFVWCVFFLSPTDPDNHSPPPESLTERQDRNV